MKEKAEGGKNIHYDLKKMDLDYVLELLLGPVPLNDSLASFFSISKYIVLATLMKLPCDKLSLFA